MTDRQQLVGGFLFKRNISAVLFPSNCCCGSSVTSRCTFRKNSCRACNRRKIVTKLEPKLEEALRSRISVAQSTKCRSSRPVISGQCRNPSINNALGVDCDDHRHIGELFTYKWIKRPDPEQASLVASAYSDANFDRFGHPINVQGVDLCQTGQRERTVSPTSLQLGGRAHHLDVRRRNTFRGRAASAQRLWLQVTAPNPYLPVGRFCSTSSAVKFRRQIPI